MNEQRDLNDIHQELRVPLFKWSDSIWLVAISCVMLSSGVWDWLSPRPEIGQVAVLWLPNAVIFVAILRNWGRWFFCALACIVFCAVGIVTGLGAHPVLSDLPLLMVDLAEVWIFASIFVIFLGRNFRFNSAFDISVFTMAAVVACAIGGILAAMVSHFSVGDIAVASQAPLQVGMTWFTSDLATYFLAAAPLLLVTGRAGIKIWFDIKTAPLTFCVNSLFVMGLTFVGFALPHWIAEKTGLMLGSGGLILIAFPLATYLAFQRGVGGASITAAAIGIPAIYATMAGIGPFGVGNAATNVFDMQATLIVCTVSLLLIGAMADGMRVRTAALERALDEAIKMRHAQQ